MSFVCLSMEDDSGDRCVDIVNDRGDFGFVECRRDPEDPTGWRYLSPVRSGYDTPKAAIVAARGAVGWMDRQ